MAYMCRCLFLAINILSYKYITQRIMKQCVVVTLLLGSSIVLPKSTFWQSAPQKHLLVIVLLGVVLLVTLLLGSSIVLPKSTF